MRHETIRVLLIEDDEDDYLITRDLLKDVQENRYELHWCSTYEEGLAALREQEPDVCLVDYRIGGRTGLELIDEAVSGGCTTPLILLTGMDDREVDVAAMTAGAADYQEKDGLTERSLERSIRHAISAARSRRELQLAQEKLKEITDSIPGAVYQFREDPDGTRQFSFMSQGLRSLNGVDAEQALLDPKVIFDQIHEQDCALLDRAIQSSAAAMEPLSCDFRIRTAEGQKWIRAQSTPSRLPDGSICWNGLFVDITRERDLEEQFRHSQKMEAFGQLTGGVAHDFNNLLMIIIGNAELLADDLADHPDQQAVASMILEAAERGAALNSRLLAFARRQTLEPESLDVNAAVEGMRALLSRTLGEQVTIETVPANNLREAMVDPVQLETALINLAVNARDAMSGGGTLTVATKQVSLDEAMAAANEISPGAYVMVAVRDTGTGMPPEVQARVFEPFFTTKDIGKGTGLGLSQVYGFIKQSGGHISVDSVVGEGTTIKLFLPCTPQEAGENDRVVQPDALPAEEGCETVLVVEDEPDVRQFVVKQLRGLGYVVVEAADGPAALGQLAAGLLPNLLFTDVVMPGGMNGRELAEQARHHVPDLKVLFTSGYAEDIVVHQGQLDPGVRLLRKPYRRGDLAREIRAALVGATALPVQ
jgi:signal transduction histidine kinase/DNA-binding response OmpR family regulator